MDDSQRADALATNESLDVLKSALFQALEADLSGQQWPGTSKAAYAEAETNVDSLIEIADGVPFEG